MVVAWECVRDRSRVSCRGWLSYIACSIDRSLPRMVELICLRDRSSVVLHRYYSSVAIIFMVCCCGWPRFARFGCAIYTIDASM